MSNSEEETIADLALLIQPRSLSNMALEAFEHESLRTGDWPPL